MPIDAVELLDFQDVLDWHALPLGDRCLSDIERSGELRGATSGRDSKGDAVLGHKPNVSLAYVCVNEAFAAPDVSAPYYRSMFKETVRRIRRAKHLTQREVAEEIGVKTSSVTQWETGGGIDTPNLLKLAKVLGVPSKVLVEALEADKSGQAGDLLQDSSIPAGNNTHVVRADHKEGRNMGDNGSLKDAVLRSVLARLDRIEGKLDILQEPADTRPGPHKRRGR